MRQLTKLVGACLAAVMIAACGSGLYPSLRTAAPPIAATQSAAADSELLTANAGANLYVANFAPNYESNVTVYAPGSDKVLRTISRGVETPDALAFSPSGNLFVANYVRGTVTVYAPGKTSVRRTISHGVNGPQALAFGPSGNLFVANSNSVTVYVPASGKLLRTISHNISFPSALAFGRSGNLYVANPGRRRTDGVMVYAPGGSRLLRKIPEGRGDYPISLALDGSGNLFVSGFHFGFTRKDWITAYARGTDKVLWKVSPGPVRPRFADV